MIPIISPRTGIDKEMFLSTCLFKSSLIKSLIGEFNATGTKLLYNKPIQQQLQHITSVALNSPIKDLIREDLPAPFGPMIPIISPRTGIDKEMFA
jgi:hypothetical protein